MYRTRPSPPWPSARALRRASAALLAGRPAEAEAIVRVLGDVQSLAVHVAENEPEPEISLEEAMARNLRIARTMFAKAEELAEQLLGDGEVPQDNARWAFAWRQARLGPEAAARDRAYADRMGWTEWLYDVDGRITPEQEEEGG